MTQPGRPAYGDGPPPTGFGSCGECPYLQAGHVRICHECASESFQPPDEPNCRICRQALRDGEHACSNRLCNDQQRAFEWTAVVGVKAGRLEQGVLRLKDGAYGWGMIFARIVLGHLYTHPELVNQVDAIIPMPAYLEPHQARQGADHTGYVIERAILEDDQGLPFVLDPPLVEKTRATTRMRETASLVERHLAARELYSALRVPDPARVRGLSIMVYDDVFTGGNSLNAVALRLKASGAAMVYGLTLARAQWR
ncbi:MAG: ComF family protein [Sphaerisporangium sp.]|nr:ComF family protein [Sphaerisporangium sp.]